MRNYLKIVLVTLILMGFGRYAIAKPLNIENPDVVAFIDEMHDKYGFTKADLRGLLGTTEIVEKILAAMSRPAEGKPWKDYRKIFVTPARIQKGVAFWRANADDLRRAEQKYGVDAAVITAIIGVETFYGRHKGGYRVIDALATLGFAYPKRAAFFRRELGQFLRLTREEGLDRTTLRGSYAGAMGVPQFIPSSYREYAVDFDADGVRDLLGSVTDAIGSVANYLRRHGWRRGQAVASAARMTTDSGARWVTRDPKPAVMLSRLETDGVEFDIPNDAAVDKAALFKLAGAAGPEYWLGFNNFYAITRYNHSVLYALAVYQLAEAIRAARNVGAGA